MQSFDIHSFDMHSFEPTTQAAQQYLDQVRPDDYARTRNALGGAVTHLSPYLTHGILSLAEVYTTLDARHRLPLQHKLVFELGWRAYYRHVWDHLGDGIDQSIHAGLLPDDAYLPEVPQDILQARTGIPAIDLAVTELYSEGYVHNHARMWLASYLVHVRKVHWRAGADWMLGHLLDGDHASNHLSWQWVAGTGSSKPYLFNADNVAKYAPAPWHSPGSAIDVSYETMDDLARQQEPTISPLDARRAGAGMAMLAQVRSPLECTSDTATAGAWRTPDAGTAQHLTGRAIWLHHPWSLGAGPTALADDVVHMGVGIDTCHSQHPWSQRRWDFVTQGLSQHATASQPLWWGSEAQLAHALQGAKSVHWQPDPHIDAALEAVRAALQGLNPHCIAGPHAAPQLFTPVDRYCRSFSEWWKKTRITDALDTRNSKPPRKPQPQQNAAV